MSNKYLKLEVLLIFYIYLVISYMYKGLNDTQRIGEAFHDYHEIPLHNLIQGYLE